jgi:hypothetical protein
MLYNRIRSKIPHFFPQTNPTPPDKSLATLSRLALPQHPLSENLEIDLKLLPERTVTPWNIWPASLLQRWSVPQEIA